MSILVINLVPGTLPAGLNATPQEYYEVMLSKTRAEMDVGAFLLGQIGGSMPSENVGPWLKNNKEWWVWSQADGEYIPITQELEIGDLAMTAKSNCDSARWLFCDGRELSRNAPYDKLFAAIGTHYNLPTDTDVTKFRIPNCGSRVPIGVGLGKNADGSDMTRRATYEIGGLEMVQLAENEMPAHKHGVPGFYIGDGSINNQTGKTIVDDDWSLGHPSADITAEAGGDQTATGHPTKPHNNMMPWFSVLFKIKYK